MQEPTRGMWQVLFEGPGEFFSQVSSNVRCFNQATLNKRMLPTESTSGFLNLSNYMLRAMVLHGF